MSDLSHVPLRTCVGCRRIAERSQMVRVVLNGDGKLTVDLRATMPGRGAWLHPELECLELAQRKNAFGRALRTREPLDAAPMRESIAALSESMLPHEQQTVSAVPTTDSEGG